MKLALKLAFWEREGRGGEGEEKRISPWGRKWNEVLVQWNEVLVQWNEVLVQEEAEEEIMHILHLLRSTQVEH